jgi:glycosyltransferase involved in cell wall biosynthesis
MKNSEDKFEVSIIIPTYNRSELLEYTLRSLLLQEMGRDRFEVIIADDGSSDNTCEVIDKYRDRLNLSYVFQEDKGYRPASARNKAVSIAAGNLCLFMDSGILLNPDVLEKHVHFHRSLGPDVAALGYIYGFDHDGEAETKLRTMINPDDPAGSIRQISKHEPYFDLRDQHYTRYNDQIHLLPAPWIYFWTGHASVRRAHLLEVGMFDEQYDGRWGVEDNDLGFRLYQRGIKIHLLRDAQCIHYPHSSQKMEKEKQGLENCRYFYSKYPTVETGIFLQHYGQDGSVDINDLCKRALNKTS